VLSRTRSGEDEVSLGTPKRTTAFVDSVGAGLFLVTGAWMVLASLDSGGSAVPGVQLLLGCGLALVVVRKIGPQARVVVPAAVLLTATIIAAGSDTGVLSTAPLSGPFRYINADSAFYVQAAIAGLMLAAGAGPWLVRVLGGVGAGIFAILPFAIHALAAAWLIVLLPGAALFSVAAMGSRGARHAVLFCGLLFVASMSATLALGATYWPGADQNLVRRSAVKAVNEHRLVLWHDAFVIMRRHPAVGVGARRYQVVSPIASQDPDSRWAHNEFLQQGAEGGIAGLMLMALVFMWGFVRLWVVRFPDAVTALGAAALAALGIHASIDYVIHFPAIPVVAASLVATGMIGGETGRLQTEQMHASARAW
jgi:O-antigen ligase